MGDVKYILRLQFCRDRQCPAVFGRTCTLKGKCENQSDFTSAERKAVERKNARNPNL